MAIELIILDVDGTLTDGAILYGAETELKAFNVKDGLAIASWIRLGRQAAIITGRSSAIVERRARELGIVHCYQGVRHKGAKVEQLLKTLGLEPSQAAAMGDDLNDWSMLRLVGRSYAPSDAVSEIRRRVDRVVEAPGGSGAVRAMIEELMEQEGLREEFLNLWSVE